MSAPCNSWPSDSAAGPAWSPGREVEGELRFIAATANPATRTFRVEMEVENANEAIADGITAELILPRPAVMAHRISPAILTLAEDGTIGVKRLDAENAVIFQPVLILANEAEGLWVTGLPEEAVLVTVGHEFVKEGQRVLAIDEATLKPFSRDGASLSGIIDAAISHARTVLSLLVLILVAGSLAYLSIPKEAEPDINIPIIYVNTAHEGISAEDAERLLVKPVEQELRSIEGVKEMRSTAYQGGGNVVLEFDAGFDPDIAMRDVRDKVDLAKPELPDDAEEPTVHEINVSLFPVLVVTLSGDVPQRSLLALARHLRDEIEGISEVPESGDCRRPRGNWSNSCSTLWCWRATASMPVISSRPCRARTGWWPPVRSTPARGRFGIKLPGLFESSQDILDMPVKVQEDAVVRFKDIGIIRKTFKDAESTARINGKPAVALEISKRTGRNIIETIQKVRDLVEAERRDWPAGIHVAFSQDKSTNITTMLRDLQNNVLSAVILGDDRRRGGIGAALGRPCRRGHSRLLPERHLGSGRGGPHHQHRRPLQLDPGGRHAGGRGHRGHRIRRSQDDRRLGTPRRLCLGGQTHELADHRRHRDDAGGLPALGLLAGPGGRVHEVPAHHPAGHPHRLVGHGFDLHSHFGIGDWRNPRGPWRAVRPRPWRRAAGRSAS